MTINATNILEQLSRGQIVSRTTVVDMAQTIVKYEADILALYDHQREDGNTIAALRAAAQQQHAQVALSDDDCDNAAQRHLTAEGFSRYLNGDPVKLDAIAIRQIIQTAEANSHQPAATVSELLALLPGTYYMDPPDGGSVTLLEQLQRMGKDAERYRKARKWAYALGIGNPTPDEFDANVDSVVTK